MGLVTFCDVCKSVILPIVFVAKFIFVYNSSSKQTNITFSNTMRLVCFLYIFIVMNSTTLEDLLFGSTTTQIAMRSSASSVTAEAVLNPTLPASTPMLHLSCNGSSTTLKVSRLTTVLSSSGFCFLTVAFRYHILKLLLKQSSTWRNLVVRT